MERNLIAEAKENPLLFCANVCPGCGIEQEPAKRFSNPIGFSFAVCRNDGTVYLDPVPTESTLQRLYNDPSMSFNYMGYRTVEDLIIKPEHHGEYEAMLRMIGPVKERCNLLEVGSATGSFLMTAGDRFDVEGVELNDTTASIARNNGLRVRTGRIEDIPGRELYSIIVMLQVLEHIVDPGKLIKEVRRLLKPNGYLYVSVPNIDSASFGYLGRRHIHVSSFAHVSLFTKHSLALLGQRCGLELVAYEHFGGRDLELYDALSVAVSREGFYHRMALYSPRLYFGSKLANALTLDLLSKMIFRSGNQSYQRALFKKAGDVTI